MSRRDLLKLVEHFKNVERGLEELRPELRGSKYYHVYMERKITVDEEGNARIVSFREFLPIFSGISEESVSFRYKEAKGISFSKVNYIKREDLVSKEKLNAEAEIKQSGNQLLLTMKFSPPLKVGERVKLKYTVKVRGFVSKGENFNSVQVASFTHHLKMLIYLPKRPKRAEAYKVTVGDSDIVGRIPLGEKDNYNFVVNENIIKFEVFDTAFSAYAVVWEI